MPQTVLMLVDHIVSITKQDTMDPKCVIQSVRTGKWGGALQQQVQSVRRGVAARACCGSLRARYHVYAADT